MRPAQLTPENELTRNRSFRMLPCFNEAGAINAGKRSAPRSSLLGAGRVSMRPAQLTPENGDVCLDIVGSGHVSMRPAQLTPENAQWIDSHGGDVELFQ